MDEGFISQLQDGLAISGVNPGGEDVAQGSITRVRKQRDTTHWLSLFLTFITYGPPGNGTVPFISRAGPLP